MIVRVNRRTGKPARRRSRLRWLEYLFLFIGLLAIDYVIWINVEARVYQVYEDWKFERSLHSEDAPWTAFITSETGLRRVIGLGVEPERSLPAPEQAARPPVRTHRRNDTIGRLEIPRLGVTAIVREGDDEDTLSRAVGHIPSTALPGQIGNVAFAGHRDTFFRPLRNIRKNDRIFVDTLDGTYEYSVTTTKIVSPSDVSVLKASAERELTLVTCFPFYYIGSAPRRFVVHAVLVGPAPPVTIPAASTQRQRQG